MTSSNRRDFLRTVAGAAGVTATMAVFPPAIQKALSIPAHVRHGSLEDVAHIVIFMQENRAFDHYFGTLRGVRGFGDRFPIPVPDATDIVGKNLWYQSNEGSESGPRVITPFRLNTEQTFDYMRVSGTPHTWPNAQNAWGEGIMSRWPRYKNAHSLGYYARGDLPFQFALAEAFTLCDAYHCSFHGGTNPNRVFLWTGTNDPLREAGGPVLYNDYDNLEHDPDGGYGWVTYCERLQTAGISWQVYQDMADNFTDNPLAGFRSFRAAHRGLAGAVTALKERGLSTRDLDKLKEDVLADALPQVSWIVATAEGSEHPGPSSPAQGADYTARVLDALTANPEVWSKTVLFLMFDENDGFFDHVPPPAAPSYLRYAPDPREAELAGASTVDTRGEYHLVADASADERGLRYRPYGLGPRVPMYVISPWSKGGWVSSEVFDHTSVIRFVERRFGVYEPNISPWRRAVCGDLTSTLCFDDPDARAFDDALPDTDALAARARALPSTKTPPTPELPELPAQERGARPSRALPYVLGVQARAEVDGMRITLTFQNAGSAGAVFHVYDRKHLTRVPRRYTVEAGKQLAGSFPLAEDAGSYDLWVLGPGGFHRHFVGVVPHDEQAGLPEVEVGYDRVYGNVYARLMNPGPRPRTFVIEANAYFDVPPRELSVAPGAQIAQYWWLRGSAHWYDFTVRVKDLPGFSRRFAGRVETGRDGFSDPAMGGLALGEQLEAR